MTHPAAAQRVPELLPAKVTLIAGSGTTAYTSGATCPSGLKSTDAYGDGCLATEVMLGTGAATPGSRFAVADANGNVFFSDFSNGLIRRVDAITGVVTAIAGGASTNPAASTACGTGISVDAIGDGCVGNYIKLLKPSGLAFAANGDLYFSESDYATGTTAGAHVRKISATNGFITAPGLVTLVLGQAVNDGTTTNKGYAANPSTCTNTSTSTCVTAASSYLYAPYGLSFDAAGLLYVAEQYKEAVLVYNPTSTNATVNNIPVPAGTVSKLVGGLNATGTVQDCPNAPASTNGCTYGTTVFGGQASASIIDSPFAAAVDKLGNLYFPNEFTEYIGKVSTAGVLTQFAGTQGTVGKVLTRGAAGTVAIGSPFGLATDADNNVYFTDASSGVIWRVDADTNTQYVVAGGAATVCAASIDTYGDGCAATSATFGKSGTTYAATAIPGPGVYGVTVDAYGNLLTGDTETNLVRKVGTGAQFGVVNNTTTVDTLLVHYGVGDGPASATPYTVSTGATLFKVGTPGACTSNTDSTMDCAVPVTATPTANGAFTGVLTVTSKLGKTATFTLSGYLVPAPPSRTTKTTVTFSSSAVLCTGVTSYYTSSTLTLTATVTGASTPTGQVQFLNNGVAFGSPVTLTNGVAVLAQTFPAGSYSITAKYSGDTSFDTSTSTTPITFTTVVAPTASFSITPNTTQLNSVVAGGTALYSFNVPTTVYGGTITFSCSGLPSGAACIFSPVTLAGTGCSLTGTAAPVVGLTITTSVKTPTVVRAGFTGRWMMLGGILLALALGLNRRRMPARFAQLSIAAALLLATSGLAACSTSSIGNPSTPKGTSTITVTGAGSDGLVVSTTVSLTVN